MSMPQFQVYVAGNDYEAELFTHIDVKRRENNYDTAVLTCTNTGGTSYGGVIDVFDDVKISLKKTPAGAYTQVFGGYCRQLNPYRTQSGDMMEVKCKGYGAALEATHCNTDYGAESSHPNLDTCKEILRNIVDCYVNESLGTGVDTEYTISKLKIADYAPATSISYINMPFKTCKDAVDLICDLSSAIGAGNAGLHWIVDKSENLIINTIGAHENTAEWPDWVNTTQADSDLTNYDFINFSTVDSSDEYANKVVLITDFRKPVYDLWTQSTTGWGSSGLAAFATDTGLVGNSLKFTQNGVNAGNIYYPLSKTAAWDVTKWGTTRTIPTITFYFKKNSDWDAGEDASTGNVTLETSAGNYYRAIGVPILNINDPVDEWVGKKIEIGPYSANPQWHAAGAPSWTNINWIQISVATVKGTGNGIGWIDDLHFTGQIARCAYDSGEITLNKEHQKIFLSRYALDDSCVEADDSGTAARLAYAQLLRRMAAPYSIVFTVPLEPTWMAGQKLKVNAITFRTTEIQHNISDAGATTTVSATSDLLNSHPISTTDQHSLVMENIMVISKDAKDIRAGSEVDSLLDLLEVDYV